VELKLSKILSLFSISGYAAFTALGFRQVVEDIVANVFINVLSF